MHEPAALPPWAELKQARVLATLSESPVAASWLIEQGGQKRVLRCDRPLAAALGLDRGGEATVLGVAASAGLGPALIAADVERGYLLTEYLPGQVADPEQFRRPETLQQAGRWLARLHQLSISSRLTASLPCLDVTGAASRYALVVGSSEAHALAEAISREFAGLQSAQGQAVLCHNDIHPGNVVVAADASLRLIDWEYAALGPLEFELAAVIELSALRSEQQNGLLEAYARSGGITPGHSLAGWRAVYRDLSRLWHMALRQADI